MNPSSTPTLSGASDPLRLTDLRPGAVVRVVEIDPASPTATRLLDLGFTPGTEVRVVRRAPLGDPMLYELRGMRLCLRGSEAHWVEVRRT